MPVFISPHCHHIVLCVVDIYFMKTGFFYWQKCNNNANVTVWTNVLVAKWNNDPWNVQPELIAMFILRTTISYNRWKFTGRKSTRFYQCSDMLHMVKLLLSTGSKRDDLAEVSRIQPNITERQLAWERLRKKESRDTYGRMIICAYSIASFLYRKINRDRFLTSWFVSIEKYEICVKLD